MPDKFQRACLRLFRRLLTGPDRSTLRTTAGDGLFPATRLPMSSELPHSQHGECTFFTGQHGGKPNGAILHARCIHQRLLRGPSALRASVLTPPRNPAPPQRRLALNGACDTVPHEKNSEQVANDDLCLNLQAAYDLTPPEYDEVRARGGWFWWQRKGGVPGPWV